MKSEDAVLADTITAVAFARSPKPIDRFRPRRRFSRYVRISIIKQVSIKPKQKDNHPLPAPEQQEN